MGKSLRGTGDTLYISDDGVLTSFDLATGNVRWRLPSVGVTGLFFDDKGAIYVNTSTANPETIKYSRQIDVTEKTKRWFSKSNRRQARRSGKLKMTAGELRLRKVIYTADAHPGENYRRGQPVEPQNRVGNPAATSASNGSIRARPGAVAALPKRAPLDVRFDKNSFQLLFKQEMQILKFISL